MGKRREVNLINEVFGIIGVILSFAILILKIYILIYILALMIALAPVIIFGSVFFLLVIGMLKGL